MLNPSNDDLASSSDEKRKFWKRKTGSQKTKSKKVRTYKDGSELSTKEKELLAKLGVDCLEKSSQKSKAGKNHKAKKKDKDALRPLEQVKANSYLGHILDAAQKGSNSIDDDDDDDSFLSLNSSSDMSSDYSHSDENSSDSSNSTEPGSSGNTDSFTSSSS